MDNLTIDKPKVYEDLHSVIENEIRKRRGRWRCTNIDFEEASQLVRIRIAQKFHKWDQARPFAQWVNRLITNCLINLVRDHVVRYEKPCVHCAANEGDGFCRLTPSHEQCSECKLFKEWENTKKHAFNVKVPVTIEDHIDEINNMEGDFYDVGASKERLDELMKKELTDKEWRVYTMLFIEGRNEDYVAKEMGFKTSEDNRKPGYRMIKNYRDLFLGLAKKIIKKNEDLIHG